MRLLIIILTLIFSQSTFGQIVNSLSADNTGMYYYSVDSLIRTIKKGNKIDRIVLLAEWSTIQDFPETIQEIKIIKQDKTKKFNTKTLGQNDVLFIITGLSIIRDQITISIGTREKSKDNKGTTFFGDGVYIFYYKYLPETETYNLRQIKSGIRL